MADILQIRNLSKYYQRQLYFFSEQKSIPALDNLNISVQGGDIFGLLGPNGSGKSTALNIIAGLIKPSSGEVTLFGKKIQGADMGLKNKIGYLTEENVLPDYLSLASLLEFLSEIFGLSPAVKKERLSRLIEQFQLQDVLKKRISLLSSGQKRIASLACTFLNNPQLLILDEPTAYLDPLAVKRLSSIISALKEQGKTVIMSSHILSQVEKLCNRVAILKEGKLKFIGDNTVFSDKRSLDEFFIQVVED
jgi:ABC-2 type transport system ATP-binding protein